MAFLKFDALPKFRGSDLKTTIGGATSAFMAAHLSDLTAILTHPPPLSPLTTQFL
jgi:hypothetical protein